MHSLTSALDESEWSASHTGRFTPRERAPGTNWIGSWMGPRAGLEAVVKRKIRILGAVLNYAQGQLYLTLALDRRSELHTSATCGGVGGISWTADLVGLRAENISPICISLKRL
jgi:hypothetical protein